MFAKHWQPGKVKTRLADKIGHENASKVYLAFVEHLTRRLVACGDNRSIVYSPAESKNEFAKQFSDDWQLLAQSEGNLGQRMANFFAEGLQTNSKVILIGSDTPDINPERIQEAIDTLDQKDVVLGPCQDGGYYLIGMRKMVPEVFNGIPWSTGKVLENTVRILEEQQIEFGLLATMQDVDELPNLKRLQRDLLSMPTRDDLDEQLLKTVTDVVGDVE